MRHLLALGLLLFAALLRGDDSLLHARQAQALVGGTAWSRVIRIENVAPVSPYPHEVHALVFELDAILWFYTDRDGTQSLSLYRDRVAADEAELGPLLRAIDPGFARWAVVPDGTVRPPPAARVPNGCFLECLALLRQHRRSGAPAGRPYLLAYYVSTPGGRRGHCVLVFRLADRLRVIDPESPRRIVSIHCARPENAQAVADRLRDDIAAARWLPLETVAPAESS
jgi:hypothetical protein